jgi:protein phosphatase
MVSDDENNQAATREAFEVLHFIARRRLARGRLTVVDATNVLPRARAPLIDMARKRGRPLVAIVFNLPEAVCQERNRLRTDRTFGPDVVHNHWAQLQRSLGGLANEGFDCIYTLSSEAEANGAAVTRARA